MATMQGDKPKPLTKQTRPQSALKSDSKTVKAGKPKENPINDVGIQTTLLGPCQYVKDSEAKEVESQEIPKKVHWENPDVPPQEDKKPSRKVTSPMARFKSAKRIEQMETNISDLEDTNKRLRLQVEKAAHRYDKLKSIIVKEKVSSEQLQAVRNLPFSQFVAYPKIVRPKILPSSVELEGQDESHSETTQMMTSWPTIVFQETYKMFPSKTG